MQINVGIIAISDRASRGQYADLGGPALKIAAGDRGWKILAETLVPDEKPDIQRAIREQIAKGCQIILTTGGTGVALRDVTPEAVREISIRELPGFGEIMRVESMKLTPNAILSRSLAVVVGQTLVICLPGKPTGAVECLGFVAGAISHCVEVLSETPTSCSFPRLKHLVASSIPLTMQRANQLTLLAGATLAIAMLPLTGCVTKSKADATAKQAYLAGERHGALMQSESHVVWVVGNVRQPLVPWAEDLTLAKAIVTADYLGNRDPSLIEVFRNGQPPVQTSAQRILKGFDMPLKAGDRIEIRP